ncbi:MAG TPA: TorF family putative porin [Opitutaceae bacterium]|nr:TorF family putative porin [Opitutaceae bacterium]
MQNKLLFVLLSALSVGLLSSQAQTAATTPAPAPAATAAAAPAASGASWVFTPAVVSQYMFRGTRLGGPSFEPSVEFDSGNLALGIWSNFPLKDKVPGQSDPEIDPYGSYKFVISDAFNLQPGFTWYTYVNADKNNGYYKSTFEPSLAVNYTVAGFTLTPKIYYDLVLKGPTAELNAAYALPLKELGTELDFAATWGTFKWTSYAENASPDVKNWGDYWLVGVTLPFQVTTNSKLSIGLAATEGRNNYIKQGTFPKFPNSTAVSRGVFTLSYAMTF